MKRIVFAFFALLLSIASPSAGQAATASANATAEIEMPIALSQVTLDVVSQGDLVFGKIVAGSQSSTVRIAGDDTRTLDAGDATLLESVYGAAVFLASGMPNASYVITLPSSTTISSGEHSMTVDSFTKAYDGPLDASGQNQFTVGGTLHLDAAQPAGTYTGTFNVSVAYD